MNIQVIGTFSKKWESKPLVIESQDQLSKLFLDVFGLDRIGIPSGIDFSKRKVVVFGHVSPPLRDVFGMLVSNKRLDLECRTMHLDQGRGERVTFVSIPKEFAFDTVRVDHVVSKNPEDFSVQLQELKHLIEDLEWNQVTDPNKHQAQELERLKKEYSSLADTIINTVP